MLLNVTPDHLDRHGDLDRYEAAKLRLFESQDGGDTAVVPDGYGEIPGAGSARRVLRRRRAARRAAPFPGEHNRENAAAATAAARAAGIPDEAIAEGLRNFTGVPHRLETVRELDGVRYVNDSKATNPEAAERALTAFPGAGLHADPGRLAKERRLLRSGSIRRGGRGVKPRVPDRRVGGGNRARAGRRRRPVRESGDLATAVGEAAAPQ